jgi:hypothetical protein
MNDTQSKVPYGCLISLGEIIGPVRTMLYKTYGITTDVIPVPNKQGAVVYELEDKNKNALSVWLGFQNKIEDKKIRLFIKTEQGGIEHVVNYSEFDFIEAETHIVNIKKTFERCLHDILQVSFNVYPQNVFKEEDSQRIGILTHKLIPNFEMCAVKFLLATGDEIELVMPREKGERVSNKDKFTLVNGVYSYYPHLEMN